MAGHPPRTVAMTGAAGKTGRAVLARLRADGFRVRPVVRYERGLPGEAVADLRDRGALAAAFAGADAVHHVPPNLAPDEVEMGEAVLAAARDAGVRRLVYHSVLRPGVEAMPHHWAKLRVEERCWASGLDVTVLQPCVYADNFTAAEGELPLPYSPDAPFSFVTLDDVATAVSAVLRGDGHVGATYELAGPERLSVSALGACRGFGVRQVSVEDWLADHRQPHTYAAEALAAMFRWYDAHGLVGSPTVLRALLGREPAATGVGGDDRPR